MRGYSLLETVQGLFKIPDPVQDLGPNSVQIQ